VEILAVLLQRPLSEKALLKQLPDLKQSQANKKLARLSQVGLIRRHGQSRRNAMWEAAVPIPTKALLCSLLELSDALDSEDQAKRNALRDQLAGPKRLVALQGGQEHESR
jgi:hypothetical protein